MGFLSKKLYPKLPVVFQNLGITLYGILWNYRRFGGIYKNEYLKFKNRENYSTSKWQAYQEKQLRKIICHAYDNVKHYNNSFSNRNITKTILENISLKNLKEIPFLEKEDLRLFGKSDLISNKCEIGGVFFASSGSTGTPTNILYSFKMQQRYAAAHEARCRNWAGLTKKSARGMIGGRRIVSDGVTKAPIYRYNAIEKQVYFSAYHISPETAINYVKAMVKYEIEYMTGYAMSNFILARFIEDQGLIAPKLKAVITSSEKLTPKMRSVIERVYQCKTFDGYSGVEACGMITECEHGKLHISPDVGIIEILKEDDTYAKPGEVGEAVCTGFLNYDQPLIRYRIGDLIKLSINQSCRCGRSMPVVDEIVGRREDTILGHDGREMVRFHGLYIDIPGLVASQIIQEEIGKFSFNLIVDRSYSYQSESIILKRLESQLGEVEATFNYPSEIPKNVNGKFQAVVSRLKQN